MNHSVLYRDEDRYSSFPSVAAGDRGELWVGFDWKSHTPRARGVEGAAHSHSGGLAGGATGHVELFSPDRGESWFEEGKDYMTLGDSVTHVAATRWTLDPLDNPVP